MSRSQPEYHHESSGTSFFALLGAIGLGAAVMYLFDPDSGRRRRDALWRKYDEGKAKLHDATQSAVHQAADQTRGAIARVQARIAAKPEQTIDVTSALPDSTTLDRGNPG